MAFSEDVLKESLASLLEGYNEAWLGAHGADPSRPPRFCTKALAPGPTFVTCLYCGTKAGWRPVGKCACCGAPLP